MPKPAYALTLVAVAGALDLSDRSLVVSEILAC